MSSVGTVLSPVFIGGNGGMKPRHAQLFAQDVPPSKVFRIIDRYVCWGVLAALTPAHVLHPLGRSSDADSTVGRKL